MIKFEIIIEAGTPSKFLNNGKIVADALQKHLCHLEEHINSFGGYVTIKQKNDGNYTIQPHCTDRVTLEEMDKIIINLSKNS